PVVIPSVRAGSGGPGRHRARFARGPLEGGPLPPAGPPRPFPFPPPAPGRKVHLELLLFRFRARHPRLPRRPTSRTNLPGERFYRLCLTLLQEPKLALPPAKAAPCRACYAQPPLDRGEISSTWRAAGHAQIIDVLMGERSAAACP